MAMPIVANHVTRKSDSSFYYPMCREIAFFAIWNAPNLATAIEQKAEEVIVEPDDGPKIPHQPYGPRNKQPTAPSKTKAPPMRPIISIIRPRQWLIPLCQSIPRDQMRRTSDATQGPPMRARISSAEFDAGCPDFAPPPYVM